ncbi:hypothetical protein [uncultured Aquimarina sp.]|uniref:hypothetical protein n=1 Tax=uncultured Aquimarina sp. TaxID=575652 RepID=UPI002620655D|nr:hypothetical protein [uncultured Aquimarina sp.]
MANNLDIQLNKDLNRWELLFSNIPEGKLSDYLVRLGYRFNPRKPRLFYAPKQEAYKMFGEDLKIALQEDKSYTDIVIKPSHIPDVSNIIHSKFSYVTISYQRPKSTGKKNFVIFDQYKKIAEAIAQQYGERVYGEKLISVEATPRVEKGKAKKLLEKNAVINPLEVLEDNTTEKEKIQKTGIEGKNKSLTNDSGVYTEETAGDRLETITIPIPATAKFDAIIKIVYDENDKYRFATSTHKNFGDHSGGSSPVSQNSSIYETREEVLLLGFREIVSRIESHIEQRDSIISDQDKKNRLLNKALKATLEFAKELNVDVETKSEDFKSITKEGKTNTQKKTKPKEEKEVQPDNSKSKGQKIAEDHIENIEIPIPEDAKYKASVSIVQNATNQYRFEVSHQKTFGDQKKHTSEPKKKGLHYSTKDQALIESLKEIVLEIKIDILDGQKLYNDHDKFLYKALEAIRSFAEANGLDWEEVNNTIASKVLKDRKAIVNDQEQIQESSTHSDLQKLVSTISEQLQKLADQTTTLGDKALIETEKIQFNDALELKGQDSLKDDIKRILSEQDLWIKKINDAAIKEKYVATLNRLAKTLNLPILEIATISDYIIVQKWTTIKEDMLERFQELIDAKPDTLQFTYLPSADGETDLKDLEILKVEIESDLAKIGFLYEKKRKALIINSFNLKSEGIVSYSGSAIPMGKLKSAISYMVAHPETLKIKPYTIAPYENLYKAQARDIQYKGVTVPNVLIPKGVVNTVFEVGSIKKENAEQYAKSFPKLFALTDKTLNTASAIQMFSLAQIYEPEDFGIQLSWKTLYAQWQSNGEDFFKYLGYPIDRNYPYVDITSESYEITPLGKILTSINWLSVAESYRPIADIEKAIAILNEKIESLVAKRSEYIDPKTGIAKTSIPEGEIYLSLSEQIQKLSKQKNLIREYQNAQVKTTKEVIIDNTQIAANEDIKDTVKKDKKETSTIQNQTEPKEDNHPLKINNSFGIDISNMKLLDQIPIEFFGGGIKLIHTEKTLERFGLSKINNKTITNATALQLFQLAQFHISKINIHKEVFRDEWLKRGESIFKELGFPMDLKYPYISIITGYVNVHSLETILNEDYGYSSWLLLAKEYRPISNPHTGIVEIDIQIKKYEEIVKEKLSIWKQSIYKNRTILEKDIDAIKKILKDLKASKKVIRDFLSSGNNTDTKENPLDIKVIEPKLVTPTAIPRFITLQEAERIRRQFKAKGFIVQYTGKQAFTKSVSIVELGLRYGYNQVKLDEKIQKEFIHWISILEKEIKVLEGKDDRKSKQSKIHRLERIFSLKREAEDLEVLVANEDKVFRDELFVEIVGRAKDNGYVILLDDMADFRNYLMKELFEGRMVENYPDRSIGKTVRILTSDYFQGQKEKPKQGDALDYLDKVVAIMHDHYMQARRLSQKQIENIKDIADVPNLGMLWEAVELSWLLWYKFYYGEPVSFENRLGAMIRFWNKVQPTYAYSDSSKEQYKQYSTPCPIGAIIAEYTGMPKAKAVFEPSAGNGLLVLGADPKKTHVNEIDKNRRSSLKAQGFKTITHLNAAEPFPKELQASFDVMVTNPPFATWDADSFDKKRIVDTYFNKYRRLEKNRLRLEHVMSGLALHTLKDSGKAALIILGHLYFDDRGYIAKARPFFNWLYMHYRVDDVINLNSFKLYNKQGAVAKTMLILISGRKRNPTNKSIAPTRKEAGSLDAIVDSFEELWDRVKSHIKSPLEIVIQKLKIENGYDIL